MECALWGGNGVNLSSKHNVVNASGTKVSLLSGRDTPFTKKLKQLKKHVCSYPNCGCWPLGLPFNIHTGEKNFYCLLQLPALHNYFYA
ncbi:hypothetical protein DSO57_1013215, partial [Entomophthora muscae]